MADPRTNPEAAPIVEEFRADGYEPEGFTLYSYAAVEVRAEAVAIAGTFEPDAVAAALRSHRFDTVLGTSASTARATSTATSLSRGTSGGNATTRRPRIPTIELAPVVRRNWLKGPSVEKHEGFSRKRSGEPDPVCRHG